MMGKVGEAFLIVGVVLMATGCSGQEGGSPSSATPTSSPTLATGLLCRLPIDHGTGAFLDIPASPPNQESGTLQSTDDPASQVNLPDGEPRVGLSYNWTLKRWLPVPYSWVAPDGTRYAYTDSLGRLHLVGVSDGSDTILASGATWGLYSFAADGIYVGKRDPSQQPSLVGLWRISPSGGTPQQLTAQGTWLVIGPGAAWSVVPEGLQPSWLPGPDNSVGHVLMRVDLQSGQVATWYTSPSERFKVAAVDSSGRPVLMGADNGPGVLRIVTAIALAQTINIGGTLFDVIADSHGVWTEDVMRPIPLPDSGQRSQAHGSPWNRIKFRLGGPLPVMNSESGSRGIWALGY